MTEREIAAASNTIPSKHAMLEAQGIRLSRPDGWALHVDRLDLASGEVLALLGPNGAGKSTLLQVLALVERSDAGDIRLNGTPVRAGALTARRRMAVVLQEPLLVSGDACANVTLGMRLHGLPRAERERRAQLWMERAGIAHLATRRARSLSGGEQRRVSLARALALEPLVLFLDEPFAALDAPSRRSLLTELPGWLRAAGCAAVLVTHDRDEALHLADRVAVLMDGRLRQIGPVDEVFTRPADADVARFLGVDNVVPGEVTASDGEISRVRAGTTELIVAGEHPAGPVLLTVHPEMILLLSPTEQLHTSARNMLTCRVAALEPAGGQLRVHLDAGFPLVASVTRAGAADLALSPGTAVLAAIKATAIHLIVR